MKNSLKFYRLICFLMIAFFSVSPQLSRAETSQAKTISGKVIDDLKEGLPGVNVTIKGTTQGTITDYDGNYKLAVPAGKHVLVFSFVGYLPQEVEVGSKTVINVSLKENSQALDEVIVVAYGTVRKRDVTGAMASLKPDQKDAAKVVSVDALLQGKIAGVSVSTSTASPGAASSVLIRGANSLRGDNQPLYVIDNVPQASTGEFAASAFGGGDFQIAQNPLTSLNPQDIEDIQVLKDASATAIYGSRGANGVILITTKKGKAGRMKVSASANFTVAQPVNMHKMLNLNEYANFRNERSGESSRQFFFVGDQIRYIFSGAEYDENNPSSYKILSQRDWQKEVYGNAFSQNYALTLDGGSDKVSYYISAAYKNIEGLIKSTGMSQGDLRTNLSIDLSSKVKLDLSMSGSIKQNDMMSGGDSRGGVTGSIVRTAIDTAPYLTPDDEPNLTEEAKTTVWSWIDDYDDITEEKTFRANIDLTWKISEHFSYNLRTGGNMFMQDRARWFGLELFKGQNENGSLGITKFNRTNYTVENLINFNTTIASLVDINAVAGVTYDDYNVLNKITNAQDFQSHAFRTKGLHMASIINESQPIQKDYQLLSYLGRVNLSFYEGRYLLTGTFRADGTSKFKKGNRWSYFPSVNVGWRMEQENFIKDNAFWIDQLKIRLGYGQTGNQSISPYNSFYDYEKIIDYASATGDQQLALAAGRLQNDGLQWERTTSYNAGIDYSFVKGRLSGAIDVYYKETNDLLIDRMLPPSIGFGSVILNQGSLSNKGVELSLNGDIFRTKDFTWTLSGNIGFNTPEIKKLGLPSSQYGKENYVAYLGNTIGDHFGVSNIFIEGMAPGLFWGYKTDGIIQEGDEVIPSSISAIAPGNIKFVDVDGNGKIDEGDKTIIGNPNSDFNYGVQTYLNYKGISFSASFNGVHGNQIMNGNLRYESTPSRASSNLTKEAFANAWRPENKSNLFPAVASTDVKVVSDRFIEDGSFFRCSDITIGYAIPSVTVKKIGFQGINIFASVKNLFTVTKYSGYDPEVNTFAFDGLRPGIDLNSFPNARSYVLGVNISF